MLVAFSVENYRSFREQATLSMVASDLSSKPKEIDATNVFVARDELKLLTSAAMYGPNAGGKSNFVAAISFMRNLVLNSSRETRAREPLSVTPYQLHTDTAKQPSRFEIVFIDGGALYRYGFLVSNERVEEEWLYATRNKKEGYLFERSPEAIKVNGKTFKEAQGIEERTRPNALFLSVAAQWNGKYAGQIVEWFERLTVDRGIDDELAQRRMLREYERTGLHPKLVTFIKGLDLGIDDIQLESQPPRQVDARSSDGSTRSIALPTPPRVSTVHSKYNNEGEPVGTQLFNLFTQESQGTRRLFALAEPILSALSEGTVLVIDEIDARLHPILTCAIIKLFNTSATNPRHAQLIFTTHDTNLLGSQLLRRDQIWFVEKSRRGESILYSLVQYRVRNDVAYEKNYIAGRYGAIPYLGDLGALIGDGHGSEEHDEALTTAEFAPENDDGDLLTALDGDDG